MKVILEKEPQKFYISSQNGDNCIGAKRGEGQFGIEHIG